ncbi:L-serine ammonia-lyase [Nesterenkonia halophila]|uniref:L-serine ammonia-lyase n=1 Tax=Nesterenkonia halophila TaxID=302044 RepID=UPI0012919770|nr:L-serine ammonia-lyase [Nesterenkonia halophila]
MTISVFDLFSVGIGPSSSHTVGPLRAARRFVDEHLVRPEALDRVAEIRVDLFGSLSATGAGHGTFGAVLLGLEGWAAETIRPEQVDERLEGMRADGLVQVGAQLGVRHDIALREEDFVQRPLTMLERHSNAMQLTARDAAGADIAVETYYSVGGGFVVAEGDEVSDRVGVAEDAAGQDPAQDSTQDPAESSTEMTVEEPSERTGEVPFPFRTAAELLEISRREQLPLSRIMLANECVSRSEAEVRSGLLEIWQVMEESKDSARRRIGPLPGGLKVRRRTGDWHAQLMERDPDRSHAYWQEWVNLVALAVNEENASGGRVVTAPTNGAAGIIPAVGFYATHYGPGATFADEADRDDIVTTYLLTAGAIGVLYKEQASISGAEVGCQGEVGSASSMAAAGLCEVLGGSVEQVENAAEIAMEHNLGLTCDPVSGLVQVPCIERNAIAATKAVNAARMALMGDGEHRVSLDQVIDTMRETGADMSHKYKETALGGLAVSVVEC